MSVGRGKIEVVEVSRLGSNYFDRISLIVLIDDVRLCRYGLSGICVAAACQVGCSVVAARSSHTH